MEFHSLHKYTGHTIECVLCYVQARMLLKSLLIIGGFLGLTLATVGASVPWLFPNIFTPDQAIINEVVFASPPFKCYIHI